jgi:hypothetical protein
LHLPVVATYSAAAALLQVSHHGLLSLQLLGVLLLAVLLGTEQCLLLSLRCSEATLIQHTHTKLISSSSCTSNTCRHLPVSNK